MARREPGKLFRIELVLRPSDCEGNLGCSDLDSDASHAIFQFVPVNDSSIPVGMISLGPSRPSAASTEFDEAVAGWETLTPTERRVARLGARDLTTKEIADELYISPFTVDSHLRAIYRKLDIHSRVSLARVIATARAHETSPAFFEDGS
ncbi:MAG: helix-turn-helix transcriptional regulator [Acidimicrobiales bacterium]